MDTLVGHYWVQRTDGTWTRYEAEYARYLVREGVECHVKVPRSDRPCTCAERIEHARQAVPALT